MSFFSKFLKGLGFEDEEPTTKPVKVKEKKQKETTKINASFNLKKDNKNEEVLQPQTKQSDDALVEAVTEDKQSFEVYNVKSQIEVQNVVVRLKNHETLIINLSALAKEDFIRSLDFLSGACFALGLKLSKIDGAVYMIG